MHVKVTASAAPCPSSSQRYLCLTVDIGLDFRDGKVISQSGGLEGNVFSWFFCHASSRFCGVHS